MKTENHEVKPPEEKKPEEKNPPEEGEELDQEDLDHLVDEIKEQLDDESEEIRVVRINPQKPSWKSRLLDNALSFIFDALLVVSLNGYLKYADSHIWNLLLLSLLFSVIDLILRRLVSRYFFKLMISSLGTIMIPLMIISFILAWLIIPGVEPNSNGQVMIFFVVFIIARSIMRILFLGKNKIIEIRKVKK